MNFYGIHPNVKPDYTKLSGPVLGLFAEKDGFVTPQVAKDIDAAIKKAGKQSEIHIYPGVDHGFFNDDRRTSTTSPPPTTPGSAPWASSART